MNTYWVESKHGVIVDVKSDLKAARESANHTGRIPRNGRVPCRVYTFGAHGLKVYV